MQMVIICDASQIATNELHYLFLHDVLVGQQSQKPQLCESAERKLFIVKIVKPVPRHKVVCVPFPRQCDPDVDVRQVGYQNQTLRDPEFPAS